MAWVHCSMVSRRAYPVGPATYADGWRQALAVMDHPTKCGCNHSLAVVCAVFAGAAVALFLAEDRCLDNGGRLSDVAWSCELATGGIASLWSLITPGNVVAVVAVVAIPVYLAVSAIGRRWIFGYAKRRG